MIHEFIHQHSHLIGGGVLLLTFLAGIFGLPFVAYVSLGRETYKYYLWDFWSSMFRDLYPMFCFLFLVVIIAFGGLWGLLYL